MCYSWQRKALLRRTSSPIGKHACSFFQVLSTNAEQNYRERSCLCAFVSLLNRTGRKRLARQARSEPRGDGGLMQGTVSSEAALQRPHRYPLAAGFSDVEKNPFRLRFVSVSPPVTHGLMTKELIPRRFEERKQILTPHSVGGRITKPVSPQKPSPRQDGGSWTQAQHTPLRWWFLGWQPPPCSLSLLKLICGNAQAQLWAAHHKAYGSSPCCLLLLSPSNFPSWGLPKSPQRPEGPRKLGHRKWAGTEKGRICQQQDWGLTKHSWISPPVFHSSVWTSVHRITWHPHSAKLLEVPSSLRRRFPSLRVSWSGRPARLSQALLLSNHLQKAQFCLQLLWGEGPWWEFTPQKSDVGHFQAEACSGLDLKQWLCFFEKHAGRLQEDVKSSLLMLILTWSAMNTIPRTC